MGKVFMFPVKRKIPKGLEERFMEIAKDYVETLKALTVLLDVDINNDQEYEEILQMVQETFAKGIIAAVDEMD